jgi:hypothetical protein
LNTAYSFFSNTVATIFVRKKKSSICVRTIPEDKSVKQRKSETWNNTQSISDIIFLFKKKNLTNTFSIRISRCIKKISVSNTYQTRFVTIFWVSRLQNNPTNFLLVLGLKEWTMESLSPHTPLLFLFYFLTQKANKSSLSYISNKFTDF